MTEKARGGKACGGLDFSVVMPCLNEERYIRRAIESLLDDDFREKGELIVVDGVSSDRTREIVREFIGKGVQVKLLENTNKTQAYGLNLGIQEARGDVILRVDAHCVYPPGYVRDCIRLLEETGAEAAGGRMWPVGKERVQEAVALALRHPVGVGDARWHLGNYKGFAESAYLGTFRRELFEEIGLYDTNCRANQDGELYLRILKAGGKIFLDGSIKVAYFPRRTLAGLAGQYFRYGKGRAYTTWKHRHMTSWRQAGPPLLAAGMAGSLAAGVTAGEPWFFVGPVLYGLGLFGATFVGFRNEEEECGGRQITTRLLVTLAWAIMHLSWGAGFLFNYVRLITKSIFRGGNLP